MPLKKIITPQDITAEYLRDVEITSELWARLDELEEKLHAHKSNPAVVGLAGFAIVTLLLQLHNVDLVSHQPAVWIGIFVGGLAQLVAGLQEHDSGDNLAYSSFSTFGAFWMSLACILFCRGKEWIDMSDDDLGAVMVVFTIYTAILWVAALKTNIGLSLTFSFLLVGFILIDSALLTHEEVGGPIHKAAGSVLIICSCLAWYVMAHLIYKGVYGKDILPVGPPPFDLLTGTHQKTVNRRRSSMGASLKAGSGSPGPRHTTVISLPQ